MKTAIVTGATSGIGKATADKLAELGYHLIITGRRHHRLTALRQEIEKKHEVSVLPLNFDIRKHREVEQAIDSLPDTWEQIDVLINNAGLARGMAPVQDGDIGDWDEMIDTNIKGLLYISRKVAPRMQQSGTGHIINIGSTAGREVYPNGNVYCATKHAVDALSKAMRIDLLNDGIKVTQIRPGLTQTEFSEVRFHGDKNRAENVYKGFQPLEGKDIAEIIGFVVQLPPHVTINDLEVTPTAQGNSTTVVKN